MCIYFSGKNNCTFMEQETIAINFAEKGLRKRKYFIRDHKYAHELNQTPSMVLVRKEQLHQEETQTNAAERVVWAPHCGKTHTQIYKKAPKMINDSEKWLRKKN